MIRARLQYPQYPLGIPERYAVLSVSCGASSATIWPSHGNNRSFTEKVSVSELLTVTCAGCREGCPRIAPGDGRGAVQRGAMRRGSGGDAWRPHPTGGRAAERCALSRLEFLQYFAAALGRQTIGLIHVSTWSGTNTVLFGPRIPSVSLDRATRPAPAALRGVTSKVIPPPMSAWVRT